MKTNKTHKEHAKVEVHEGQHSNRDEPHVSTPAPDEKAGKSNVEGPPPTGYESPNVASSSKKEHIGEDRSNTKGRT